MASRNLERLRYLMGGGQFDDRSGDAFQKRMDEVFAEDVVVYEPACLPHGGVHEGRPAFYAMRKTMLDTWEQKLDVLDQWDVPEADMVINHYMLDWTAKNTGKNVKQLAVEAIWFRDGQVCKVEFYAHDAQALAASLIPDGAE